MAFGAKNIVGYSIRAIDRDIGLVKDLYFDDERWTIRYLICNTGEWLSSRKILISPISILEVDEGNRVVHVNLTHDLVEKSPDISLKQPVSRRMEAEYSEHFNLPIYWGGGDVWGGAITPKMLAKSSVNEEESLKYMDDKSDEAHLRSTEEVIGYHVKSTDGSIGHIEDFHVDPDNWQIRLVIVDTKKWLPGKKVMIAPKRINDIHWADSTVFVHMTKEAIQDSPELR